MGMGPPVLGRGVVLVVVDPGVPALLLGPGVVVVPGAAVVVGRVPMGGLIKLERVRVRYFSRLER